MVGSFQIPNLSLHGCCDFHIQQQHKYMTKPSTAIYTEPRSNIVYEVATKPASRNKSSYADYIYYRIYVTSQQHRWAVAH